jgi:hypothetical protein
MRKHLIKNEGYVKKLSLESADKQGIYYLKLSMSLKNILLDKTEKVYILLSNGEYILFNKLDKPLHNIKANNFTGIISVSILITNNLIKNISVSEIDSICIENTGTILFTKVGTKLSKRITTVIRRLQNVSDNDSDFIG